MSYDFVARKGAFGWVIIRRADRVVMTPPMSRTDAHIEVWRRNGCQVPALKSWKSRLSAAEQETGTA